MKVVMASVLPTNQFSSTPWLLLGCSRALLFLCEEDAILVLLYLHRMEKKNSRDCVREGTCTDQVVGSGDVAARDNIGVLSGTPG